MTPATSPARSCKVAPSREPQLPPTPTHINRDRLELSGNQRARQMIKIARATARIREQHDRCAQAAKCAFQRRVTDVDASMLLQSHLPLFAAYGARPPVARIMSPATLR